MGPDAVSLKVVPANEASWQDLQTVFGDRGPGYRCQCQRYKLSPGESSRHQSTEERAARLREQAKPDSPDSHTSGLVAYIDETPVGWCAVEPRSDYAGLLRAFKVPWEGRDEDKSDPTVWAVTCLFIRAGHRRHGVSRALAAAAVDYARSCGARALEAYPIDPEGAINEELHVGTRSVFTDAGLTVIGQPSKRRHVMRIEFAKPQKGG